MHYSLLHLRRSHHRHHQIRRLYDAAASINCVRDRGLDHAVERERNLKPVLNLKNLIVSEPSKSLPLSIITQSKDSLRIPVRPIELIRRYRSVFEEFLPGGIGIQPHIKLTPEVLNYHKEEQLVYESVLYKQDVADRLLKLLMVSRINKIPVRVVNELKWELGLPQDYLKSIVPEFPDYFRLKCESNEDVLELVCWSDEHAVSTLEKKRSFPIEFPLKYSSGFEMDKKYKKWVDEWQKLPYISPYENASHLVSKSDESDKWAVAILHEVLNLFVGKKAEREVLLGLGEWLGLRSRFKRAFLQHPGIFYVSSKLRTHTVVLRDGFNRGMLVERLPLMEVRFKYVQLMNTIKEDPVNKEKPKESPKEGLGNNEKLKESAEDDPGNKDNLKESTKIHDGKDKEEQGEFYELSDEQSTDDYEDHDDDDDDEPTERKNSRASRNRRFEVGESPSRRNSSGRKSRFNVRTDIRDSGRVHGRSSRRNNNNNNDDDNEYAEKMNSNNSVSSRNRRFEGRESQSTALRGPARRNSGGSTTKFHLRTETRDFRGRSQRRNDDNNSDGQKGRMNSKNKRAPYEKQNKVSKSAAF
ncbi:OLC1v1022091C1 [Oldenlandia corymbosa var. corymbosa]|uniref:OLC1v1022091C1 n=1 Tax=Oldenlandia corymbosa var. corymbosa TaxID=529605 RepID=A0AAV1BZD4_OLDCO|nr:OLC1v1022091C1 [Oldenlandia corymbosa var. corymbosa]